MHPALLISELFREICALLNQASLPAVARTCRALQEPALDELWRDLYSIYPFVHLFSQHKCEASEQEWATLRRYSARTRSLYVCMIEDSPSERFPSLSNAPDLDTFFPNVRAVAWYPVNHMEMLPFLRLLCGPSLICFSAEFATDPSSLAVLASFGTLCPNITDISISAANSTPSDELTIALSTSVCHWKNLYHVSCDDLTIKAMEHLSQVRSLESLTACASGRMSSFSQSVKLHEPSFSRLQHLHLYAGQVSTTISCLRGLHLALKEFRLDLFDAEEVLSDSSCLRNLFSTVAETCSRSSLTRLELCIIHSEFPSPDSLATIRDVRPLLHFNNLQVVCFEGVPTLSFTDDDIAELASAWPHVEELVLSTYVNHPIASLPTFQSLVHLVRSCPKLRALSLVVDATKISETSIHAAVTDVRSDILDDLCLGNSPVRTPVVIAHILCNLYPALKHVDLSVWNKDPLNRLPRRARYEEWWGMVNIELRALRAARQEPIPFTA